MLDIQEVGEEKFDEIWSIFHDVIKEEDTYPYPANITKEEAKKLWFAPGAHVYIAYLKDKAVASRYIVPNKAGLGSHIANIGVIVDRNCRGKGIGKLMMEFALKKTKELGFKAILLNYVVSTNTSSINICKKYGFEIIGTIPKAFFYKQEKYVDAHIMYRSL